MREIYNEVIGKLSEEEKEKLDLKELEYLRKLSNCEDEKISRNYLDNARWVYARVSKLEPYEIHFMTMEYIHKNDYRFIWNCIWQSLTEEHKVINKRLTNRNRHIEHEAICTMLVSRVFPDLRRKIEDKLGRDVMEYLFEINVHIGGIPIYGNIHHLDSVILG